jgi:hypothetical protein
LFTEILPLMNGKARRRARLVDDRQAVGSGVGLAEWAAKTDNSRYEPMKGTSMKWQQMRRIAGPLVGAAGGFAYYKWVTCRGGG